MFSEGRRDLSRLHGVDVRGYHGCQRYLYVEGMASALVGQSLQWTGSRIVHTSSDLALHVPPRRNMEQ